MRRLVPVWLVLALLWALPLGAHALEPAPLAAPGDVGPARVVFVTERLRHQHFIEVRVQGLREWTRRGDGSPWKLVPYIDQRALAGLYPVAVDTASGTLQYMLRSNADNADTWAHLLSPLTFERPVRFSVGLEHEDALPSAFGGADGRVKLIVVDRLWSAMAVVVVLGALLAANKAAKSASLPVPVSKPRLDEVLLLARLAVPVLKKIPPSIPTECTPLLNSAL